MAEVRIKLDTSTIQKIALFESITRANLKDCFESDDDLVFIVSPGDFGKAIGKGGANIRALEKKFNKKIILIEFNPDPEKFATNLFKPIPVKSAELEGNTMNLVIKSSLRAFPSKKVKKTKMLLKKYFPAIEEVIVKV
ncbi:MAG: NusA-like transcription termination signal-binding factor [Nanoarchaeota archaeon]|nr:NusA-like transcription termination signal-binding factor [Nanoarchaeota archaeon]